jgi:hypothetical protein
MPGIVKNAWAGTGSVQGAYLWRETDASPFPGALNRLNVRYRRSYAIIMDNSTISGLPEGYAHNWEWTNILYSEGHVAGALNDYSCSTTTITGPLPDPTQPPGPGNEPTQTIEYRCHYTQDDSPGAMTQVWLNADAQSEK